MTDQCKRCPHRGDIKSCEAIDCSYHDSWYAKEQQKQIKQLKQELKTANESLDIAYQVGAEGMKKERDALKAHCEKLQVAVKAGYEPHMNYIHQLDCTSDELLSQTPDQSLAEIQAQSIKDAIGEATIMWSDNVGDSVVLVDELYEYAQQIREGITK